MRLLIRTPACVKRFTCTANDGEFHTSCETKVWLCQSHNVYLQDGHYERSNIVHAAKSKSLFRRGDRKFKCGATQLNVAHVNFIVAQRHIKWARGEHC